METIDEVVKTISSIAKKKEIPEYTLKNSNKVVLGRVDYAWKLNGGVWIFLEYENKQRHPCTNVLKLWPYMNDDSKESRKVLLIQLFESKGLRKGNRIKLADFVAKKIRKEYPTSFEYAPFYTQAQRSRCLMELIQSTIKGFM